eukprot:6208658-Pleurochrysis_carterae.AAC.2
MKRTYTAAFSSSSTWPTQKGRWSPLGHKGSSSTSREAARTCVPLAGALARLVPRRARSEAYPQLQMYR